MVERIIKNSSKSLLCVCRLIMNFRSFFLNSPPKRHGLDDATGEPLIQRSDDNVETLRKRLATYHQQTGPVADYYKTKGLWQGVDATQSPSLVWDSLSDIYRGRK